MCVSVYGEHVLSQLMPHNALLYVFYLSDR